MVCRYLLPCFDSFTHGLVMYTVESLHSTAYALLVLSDVILQDCKQFSTIMSASYVDFIALSCQQSRISLLEGLEIVQKHAEEDNLARPTSGVKTHRPCLTLVVKSSK